MQVYPAHSPPGNPPAVLAPYPTDVAQVPAEFAGLRHYVAWEWEWRIDGKGQGKWTKPPVSPTTGARGDCSDPATWGTFAQAVAVARRARLPGIGVELTEDMGIVGGDLDKCRDPKTGAIEAWALDIIRRLDTLAYVSPTGTGLRFFLKGSLPGTRRRTGSIEVYSSGRYLTLTTERVPGCPDRIEERQAELDAWYAEVFPPEPSRPAPAPTTGALPADDTELVRRAEASKDGPKFRRLMAGDTSDYGGDDSAADLGLCNLLRFYGGSGDRTQVDRLFRRSRLYREKWDERRGDGTYGSQTITKALTGEVYTPAPVDLGGRTNGHASPPPVVPATPPVAPHPSPRWHATDLGNAQRFASQHGHAVRYCHAWKKWLVWDGTRWLQDETGAAVALAKRTAVSIHGECADPQLGDDDRKRLAKWAFDSESRGSISAMLGLAESEAGLPVRPDDLDGHKHLLNCPNGTIDLRTGELLPHDPAQLLTKSTGVAYDPALRWREAAPRWAAFLERIQPTLAIRRYLQKAAGYTLKGTSGERVVLIPYGKGRNGKSTLLEALRDVLGEYAVSLPVESLIQQRNEGNRPSNDIARTRGARYVWTRESEEGRRLNESLLKQLTGGMDTVTARFLYQESFDFRPEFTLWFSTNHRPIISGSDDGIWDRIKLVPFEVRITDDELDPDLPDRLREEAPGILRWAVEGCLLWQEEGLSTPEAVSKATDDYRQDMDVLGRFLEERCLVGPQFSVKSAELHAAYSAWCAEANEKSMSQTAFSTKLADRPGITKDRKNTGMVFFGVGMPAKQEVGA